jgi:integrase/recombinase XerC
MVLISERFDLDETVPEPNAPRSTTPRKQWVLPRGFPFLIDEETGEVLEPVLLYLRDRYNAPSCYQAGTWKKQDSADAAVSDLKDWWGKLEASGISWNAADDQLLAEWLIDMRTITSGRTNDFLADATVIRRCSTVCSFYQWALGRGLIQKAPEASSSRKLATMKITVQPKRRQTSLARRSPEPDPHPISSEHVAALAAAMGPLPSDRAAAPTPEADFRPQHWPKGEGRKEQSSRDRIAFELGLNSGLRIDEILNLPAQAFDGFKCEEKESFRYFELRITHTKGLRPREIWIPNWLMSEVADYLANERATAIAEARRLWLGDGSAPSQLLLNGPGTGRHVGKPARAEQVERRFNQACIDLGLVKDRIRAQGTADARITSEVRHRFHDTRHTFAVTMFHALEHEGFHKPWIRIQKLLGHASVSTTISIYLKVLDSFGPDTLEELGQRFREMRESRQIGGHRIPATSHETS